MPTPTPVELLWLGLVAAAGTGLGLRFLSPTARRSEAFLRGCGVPTPAPAQSERAAAYLRERRQIFLIASILLVPGLAGLAALVGEGEDSLAWGVVGGLVGGLLVTLAVAEVMRTAHRWRDTTRPGWRQSFQGRRLLDPFHLGALVVTGALFVSGLLATAVGFVAQHWANDVVAWHSRHADLLEAHAFAVPPQGFARLWLVLAGLLAVAAAATVAVWLSLSGEPDPDDPVLDNALRVRTARVAIGTGALASALLAMAALRRLTIIVLPRLDQWAERVLPPGLAWEFPTLPSWLPPAQQVLDSFLTPFLAGCALCLAVLVHPTLWWPGRRRG